MMGRETLSSIRERLRQALEASGEDAFARLESIMRQPKKKPAGESEVIKSLRRFLEGGGKRPKRGGKKK